MKQSFSALKKKWPILFALLILFVFLLFCKYFRACSTFSADDSFTAFADELFRQELASNTISLHYTLADPSAYQLEDTPIRLGECTTDAKRQELTLEKYLTALEVFSETDLSPKNQWTYKILHSYLTSAKEGTAYLLYDEPLSPVTGIHAQLPILLSEYQFYTVNDISTYLQLLSQIGNYFDSIISFENQKKEAGLFMPDYQVDQVLAYCKSFLQMGESHFLNTSFSQRLNELQTLSAEDKSDFLLQNKCIMDERVYPAYQMLCDALSNLKGSGINENGLCHFPKGKEYYEYLVRSETGLSESIPQLQLMTEEQIAEDLLSLKQALQTGDDTTLPNSSLLSANPVQMLESLKESIFPTFPAIPEVNVEIKYVSSAMEDYLSPAFYMIPAIDNTKDNVIYINKGQTLEGINLYTTLAHEGYPGHLYQTIYFASTKPHPLRNILSFGGYVEGWATYTEMMSYYLAPLSKKEQTLLQKNTSIILGLYALADMGIHYDGWTLEQMIHFFKDYGISDTQTLQEIYQLIIGTPANYTKYYLGYLKFYTLKKQVAADKKEDFSQIDFHKAVLDIGPAPFDIVEEYLRETLY